MRRRSSTTVSVEVDVGEVLSEIDTDDLLEELKSRKIDATAGGPELDEASAYYARGETRECLIHLERALPRTFCGLADRVLGPIR